MVLAGSCKAQSFYIIYYFIIMDGEEMVGSDSVGLLRIVIVFYAGWRDPFYLACRLATCFRGNVVHQLF